MTCEKFFEIAPLFINGSLDKNIEKEAFEHLIKCEECRCELAFWTHVVSTQDIYKLENKAKVKIASKVIDNNNSLYELTKKALKIYFEVIKANI